MPRVDTLIEHATILDGAGHRLENSSLLLRDGKVAGIGCLVELNFLHGRDRLKPYEVFSLLQY